MADQIWDTRRCADHLGVSTWFIRKEINIDRLKGEAFERRTPSGGTRCLYRIPLEQFRAYCAEYWPEAAKRLPPVAA